MKFVRNDNSLYNGISQQAVELRLPNQVTEAINAKLSVSYGLEKRPPAELISRVESKYSMDTLVHAINRDQNEQYVMVWADTVQSTGSSTVFDLEGNELPIVYESTEVQDYVETISQTSGLYQPSLHTKLTTVLDNTILVNKNVVASMDGAQVAPDLVNGYYLWIKDGVVQVERKVTLDGSIVVTSPKGTLNDTSVIVDGFLTSIGGQANFTTTKISESVLLIQHTDLTPLKVTQSDSYGDTTMALSNILGTDFEDLPPRALDDEVIKITSSDAQDSEYYLKFDERSSNWFEATGAGETFALDVDTMPKTVVRRVDDLSGTVTGTPSQIYFSVENIEWGEKVTGDVEDAPNPSFVDSTITDVFFYKNRVGFLSGENVILSKIDDLFNFFPTTVKEVLDDDPVDISVSSNTALNLIQVATFPDSLIIFGTTKQFTLHSDGKPFTASNITIDPTTSYNANIEADPVSVGSSLYFNAPIGRYSSMREMAITPDTLVADATDVTGHVPRFLPANVKQIIAEPNLEYLFLVDKTEADLECDNTLWVYKFFWQGNEKIQSAWTKWNIWCNPIGGGVFSGDLVILAQDGDFTNLVKFNLEDQPEELLRAGTDVPFKITLPLIDNQVLTEDIRVTFTDTGANVRVDESVWDQYGLECPMGVLVDRWTGEEYTYNEKFTSGAQFYLSFTGVSGGTNTPFTFDPRVLGTYTTGNNEIQGA